LSVPVESRLSGRYDRRLSIRLHRCSNEWLKITAHPCWKVQKALDEQGIDYELVKGPVRRGKRDELERLSGQRIYPVIEFDDGRVYRAESSEMVARIRSGQLLSAEEPAGPPASA
jgi:glutaredoxin